jgi:cobalt-precorrin-5B (C1)-methyltransferase
VTPSGKKMRLKLIDQKAGKKFARCGVVKDAGDDPDVTHGVKIYAEVKFSKGAGVSIRGGKGVGIVTKPGLAIPVGECAINPVPRQMIIREVSPYMTGEKGLEVVISVPEGEELARRTFNPRLGIIGGISIIGTTGIVEPKSEDAYKASLSIQLDVLKAAGHRKVILVLGYVGERFCKDVLGVRDELIIKIGDHVGFMLEECVKKGFKNILLIGYIGKLVKVANGQFNTHIKYGDNRIETIARYASHCGAKKEVIAELSKQTTAEAAIYILRNNNLTRTFDRIAKDVTARIDEFFSRQIHPALACKGRVHVKCLLLSLKGERLA